MNDIKQYNKGDLVKEPGKYVCVPCGFHCEYKAGDSFGECTSCLAGSNEGDDSYIEGTGIWEKEIISNG